MPHPSALSIGAATAAPGPPASPANPFIQLLLRAGGDRFEQRASPLPRLVRNPRARATTSSADVVDGAVCQPPLRGEACVLISRRPGTIPPESSRAESKLSSSGCAAGWAHPGRQSHRIRPRRRLPVPGRGDPAQCVRVRRCRRVTGWLTEPTREPHRASDERATPSEPEALGSSTNDP